LTDSLIDFSGATPSRLGFSPRYSPATPSAATIFRKQSTGPARWQGRQRRGRDATDESGVRAVGYVGRAARYERAAARRCSRWHYSAGASSTSAPVYRRPPGPAELWFCSRVLTMSSGLRVRVRRGEGVPASAAAVPAAPWFRQRQPAKHTLTSAARRAAAARSRPHKMMLVPMTPAMAPATSFAGSGTMTSGCSGAGAATSVRFSCHTSSVDLGQPYNAACSWYCQRWRTCTAAGAAAATGEATLIASDAGAVDVAIVFPRATMPRLTRRVRSRLRCFVLRRARVHSAGGHVTRRRGWSAHVQDGPLARIRGGDGRRRGRLRRVACNGRQRLPVSEARRGRAKSVAYRHVYAPSTPRTRYRFNRACAR